MKKKTKQLSMMPEALGVVMRKIDVLDFLLRATRPHTALFAFCLLLITLLLSGCGIYSFTGTKVDDNLKAIQVLTFTQQVAGGPANLAQSFTEKIKEYYQRNTNMKLVQASPDVVLEGQITTYEVMPVAPSVSGSSNSFGNSSGRSDAAGLNRLTMTVQVKYTNNRNEELSFDESFTFYQDFPQGQTLNQVESTLIPKLFDQIILDIFNKSAGDW